MANNSITYTELDFDTLKASLKAYLQGNQYFRDYDFEGANINVLLDLLAYNTHKNAFYLNMVMAESFLDSAQLRASVVSHAKELNYLPISYRSAKATVTVEFEATGESQPYIIPKGSQFSTVVKSQAYTFTLPENIQVSSSNNSYSFTADIYEGFYLKDTFVFVDSEESQRFRLSNKQVDTNSISVVVYEDGSDIGQIYTRSATLLGVEEDSKVYFLQAAGNDYYEIIFGDGVLGQQPKINSQIVVDYRVASGSDANGARIFSMDFDPTNNSEMTSYEVTTVENSAGGVEAQSTELIRRYAPRYFASQQRAVSSDDYASLVLAQFGSQIQDVIVYGGDQLEPKMYGRVVIAMKPVGGDIVPTILKNQISNYLRDYIAIPTRLVIRDAEFFYAQVVTTVQYDLSLTNKTAKEIETIVMSAITDYSEENLESFDLDLRYSKFVNAVDNADLSITSNDTELRLIKKLAPATQTTIVEEIDFNNELYQATNGDPAIYSSYFTYYDVDGNQWELSKLEDDGSGNLRVYSYVNNIKAIHNSNIGTVDYETGIVNITNLVVSDYDNTIDIYAYTATKDFVINKNMIIQIAAEDVDITVIGTLN